MATEKQKPDEHGAASRSTEPAESAPRAKPVAEPVDLVDAFADDELDSYEPRRARPVTDQDQ